MADRLPAHHAPTDNQNFLRSSGQARWFKVPVLANSRLTVTAKNLPADYDLVVFKDIQAKYDELVSGAAQQGPNLAIDDLNKQGAETPVDVFNTSQYNPSSWDPTNWKPDLNANVFTPQFSPTEYSPTEYSAAVHVADGVLAHGVLAHGVLADGVLADRVLADRVLGRPVLARRVGDIHARRDPRTFSAAQTASLVAVSAGAGTGDESVAVNTWNNTGDFYIRVQGKNGSFDADTAVLAGGLVRRATSAQTSSTRR